MGTVGKGTVSNFKCPHCSSKFTRILQTRDCGVGLKRTRECEECDRRLDTLEILSDHRLEQHAKHLQTEIQKVENALATLSYSVKQILKGYERCKDE